MGLRLTHGDAEPAGRHNRINKFRRFSNGAVAPRRCAVTGGGWVRGRTVGSYHSGLRTDYGLGRAARWAFHAVLS
jgi:hypothetical protein